MKITKDYFEKQLSKHGKVTVYAQDNTPLIISRAIYICRTSHAPFIEFEMDCEDLESFCKNFNLTLDLNAIN
ncbi:MAG: hypothetical protein ACI4J7_10425 [Ruminiclostridium sp.]